ncbi:Druantia anti-phage system protein DruA [Fervidicola ferrireducens]|nr:Druantia anti-phage system protein DruA [Fervidicola ferrireducens]
MTDLEKARYRRKVIEILKQYGIELGCNNKPIVTDIRELQYKLANNANHKYFYLARKYNEYIAQPWEVEVEKIYPELVQVQTPMQAELWKYATSFWSVPVTSGYGRRMRFLILDKQNSKLIGILGLNDPVIGLGIRDKFIGWDKKTRTDKLYHVLSAYVLGALPPYNYLLGAKLIALLCRSKAILEAFKEKYAGKKTIITKQIKPTELVLIDTMGAFGKSAIYNKLKGWNFVGYTDGVSHLHLTMPELWEVIKEILPEEKFRTYKFGQGPNWKMRMTRDALRILGFKENILEINWKRGYYICPLATNWREYLLGESEKPIYNLISIQEARDYWLQRWVLPRKNHLLEKLYVSEAALCDCSFEILALR